MSKWQKCDGKYVANDPCYPFCSLADGSGCDYSPIVDGNSDNPFGLTSQYTVTYGDDPLTGNYSRRTYSPVIDPYQSQVPPSSFDGMKGFDGDESSEGFESMFFDDDGTGFKSANGLSPSVFDFTIVPTFDRSDFFDDSSPTRYRWSVLD
tara:strand:- start:936 stop:1385 length:450 start_codon:yes stop_codon:yes gene_type:complete